MEKNSEETQTILNAGSSHPLLEKRDVYEPALDGPTGTLTDFIFTFNLSACSEITIIFRLKL